MTMTARDGGLKPCPFCGSISVTPSVLEYVSTGRYRVVCDHCGAEGPAVVERFRMRDVTDIGKPGEHERDIERHSAGMEKASALWDGRDA